jgi:hypothetical protein
MTITVFDVISGLAEYIIEHVWPEKETFDIAEAIKTLINKNDIVVQFVKMCIGANTGKTRCYFDARAIPHPHPTPHRMHVSVRKKVQLALYEYLKSEEAPPPVSVFCYRDTIDGDGGTGVYGVTLYFIETKEMGFFEDVQTHFADEVEKWMRHSNNPLSYNPAPLSTCPAPEGTELTDFVFEIGELDSAEIAWYGHWHNGKWKRIEIFDEFNLFPLMRILAAR